MTDESASSGVNDEEKRIADTAMKCGSALVRATKALPKRGGDFEYCNSFSVFNELVENQRDRVLRLISETLRVVGYPTRFPKDARLDLHMDMMVNACDNIAERAGVLMDVLERAGRDEEVKVPQVIIGAESTKRAEASKVLSTDTYLNIADRLRIAHEERERARSTKTPTIAVIKPQKEFNFQSLIDNSTSPFINKLKVKHNAREIGRQGMKVIDLEEEGNAWPAEEQANEHPYRVELEHFRPSDQQMNSRESQEPKKIEDTDLTIVNTKAGLEKLVEVLNGVTEFGVDVEHNSHRSYLGLTCLLQLSTRDRDFIVDPFPIWSEMHQLNDPFTNPKILKVLHGAGSDIEWLQRDFGIYVVNMFDTYNAMRHLNYEKFSLAYLVQKLCGIVLDKQYQTDDWRIRPLPATHINYARSDTHYLLYCYDKLREELLTQGNETKNLLTAVYSDSKMTCLKVYEKPHSSSDFDKLLSSKIRFNSQQLFALSELFKWRDGIARREDESTHFVLPNHMMMKMAEALPRDVPSVLACCSPVPILVRQYALEIQNIMYTAREKPVEKTYIQEKMALGDDEHILRKFDERNKMNSSNSILRCKLDFSQSRFDEEVGVKQSVTDLSNLSIKPHSETFLNFLGNSEKGGIDLIVDDSVYHHNKKELVIKAMEEWASPFETYCLAIKEADRKRKALELLKQSEVPVTEKKMYSHHDPVVSRPRVMRKEEDEVRLVEETGKTLPRFTDDQILTRKAMKRQIKSDRRAADIQTSLPSGHKSAGELNDDADSSFGKRKRQDAKEDVVEEGQIKDDEEMVDYSKFDINMFKQRPRDNQDFDPFNQQHRAGGNKSNIARRGRGGKHRMGNMSTAYKPEKK